MGTVDWVHAQLFMGPLAEYHEIDIVVAGAEWGGFRIAAVDPDAPRWEEVTPASGRVQLRLGELGFGFDLRPEPFRGSLLVETLDAETVRWAQRLIEILATAHTDALS